MRKGRWKNHPEPVTLSCCICRADFTVRPCRAKTAKYCNYRCHQIGEGRKGGSATGERKKRESKGLAYTKTKGRHTHRVIAEEMLGRALRDGEIVHHKDGDKLNNHPSNLEVLPSQGAHMAEHREEMLKQRKIKSGY